jgi:predicted ATPase
MRRPSPKTSAPFLRRIALEPDVGDRARHPFDIPAFRDGLDLELTSRVTFFVGENGSGKSTLLEALARCCGFGVEGGGRDQNVHSQGHRARSGRDDDRADDDANDLSRALRLSWLPKATDGFFMRAESFFNFATYIDEVSSLQRYGGRPLHQQSHGESFLALFVNRFDRGIYILDEPEAALSPQRQLAFLKVIHDLEAGGQAQFLIASHSPILLAYPKATLLTLDGGPLREIAYADTEHYKLTKEFLESPDRFFKHLFERDG